MGKEKSEGMKKVESLDQQYAKDKAAHATLEADKAEMKRLCLVVFDAQQTLNKIKTENSRAAILGNKLPHDKTEIEKAEEDVKKAEKDLADFKAKIQKALDKVNGRLEELAKNPEMKKYLDGILATRMERAIKKDVAEINNYKKVQEIMQVHPHVKSTIKGIVNANRRIASLTSKIEKIESKPDSARTSDEKKLLTDSKDELRTVQANLDQKKAQMSAFFDKNYPDLTDEQRNFIFDMNTMNIDRAIAGKEKDINNRQKVYTELTGNEYKYEDPSKEQEETQERNPEEPKGRLERFANWVTGENLEQETANTQTQQNLPAKLSRWQRFKNWVKRAWNGEKTDSKNSREAEIAEEIKRSVEEKIKEEEAAAEKSKSRAGAEFRSAYKYDIVQDYIAQKESELLKTASKSKEEDKSKDEDEGR